MPYRMSLGKKIKALREHLRLAQWQFAEQTGVDQSTVSKWERNLQSPEQPQLRAIAKLAGVSTDDFLAIDEQDPPDPTHGVAAIGRGNDRKPLPDQPPALIRALSDTGLSTVPVIGVVRAGAYMSVDEISGQALGNYPMPVPAFYSGKAFGLRVEGDSMDLVYRPGTIIICVDVFRYVGNLVTGRRVVVHRRRANDLIEATVKELVVDADGKGWLWPRSSNPKHRDAIPVPVNDGKDDEDFSDGDEVRLFAVVIGSYTPEEGA